MRGIKFSRFEIWRRHWAGEFEFQGVGCCPKVAVLGDRALGSMTCEFGTLNTRDGSRCQSFVCTLVMVYS